MARRCPTTKCPKHHLRFKRGTRYCPACGNETIGLPLFPFYVHANKLGLAILGGCILVAALFVYGIIPGCHNFRVRQQAKTEVKTAKIEALPSFWRSVYYASQKEGSYDNRLKILQNLVKIQKDVPLVPADSLPILIDVFWDREQEAMEVIGKYLSTDN